MPWIGTRRGAAEVLKSLKVFMDIADVEYEKLVELVVDGEQAMGIIFERSVIKATGQAFEIEFAQWLTVRGGKIVRWKSYTDPSQILRAIDGRAA